MSQNHNFSSIDKPSSIDGDVVENNVISPDAISYSNDIHINNIHDDLTVVKSDGWANFDTFENYANRISKATVITTSDVTEDHWADFESNTEPSTEQSIEFSNEKINQDNDGFGDYGEVLDSPKSHLSSLSLNSLSSEQIESLISTCFPLESSTLFADNDNLIPFELPTFTTFNDQTKQLPCFQHSFSLWNVLSNVSNDPLGIKYQWRKSNSERLFHQALGVQERFRTKIIPLTSEMSSSEVPTTISDDNNENKLSSSVIGPHFDWKKSGLENPLTDIDSSSLSINSKKTEDHVCDINKTLDLDYYVPPLQTPSSIKEQQLTTSTTVHRNDSPILYQHSTPIKTIGLFPGSTTVLNDDTKPVIDSVPNFSFMNPKALMFPT